MTTPGTPSQTPGSEITDKEWTDLIYSWSQLQTNIRGMRRIICRQDGHDWAAMVAEPGTIAELIEKVCVRCGNVRTRS